MYDYQSLQSLKEILLESKLGAQKVWCYWLKRKCLCTNKFCFIYGSSSMLKWQQFGAEPKFRMEELLLDGGENFKTYSERLELYFQANQIE